MVKVFGLGGRTWRAAGLLLVVLLCSGRSQALQNATCTPTCPGAVDEGTWNSRINIQNRMATSIEVQWNSDDPKGATSFVVGVRLQQSGGIFNFTGAINGSTHTYNGLVPSTNYEVQVCRASGSAGSDGCGQCLRCFSTFHANEPPSAPTEVQAVPQGPQLISITWEPPELENGIITGYEIFCNLTENIQQQDFHVSSPTREVVTAINLSPNTSYTCGVSARNAIGLGEPATQVVFTPPLNTAPGVLFMVVAEGLSYTVLTEDLLKRFEAFTTVDTILTSGDTIQGIDYHFARQELYTSHQSGKINRHSLNVMKDDDGLIESIAIDGTQVAFDRGGNSLGAVAVDWVNDNIYWVEDSKRIMRSSINGSDVLYCVVSWEDAPQPIRHIAVDPNRGYFYWDGVSLVQPDQRSIFRVDFDVTLTEFETCPSISIAPDEIISRQGLDTFTLEPDTGIYYLGICNSNAQRRLQITTFNAEDSQCSVVLNSANYTSVDSFSEFVFYPEGDGVVIVNTVSGIYLNFIDAPTSSLLRTYRSVKQPLPVPPSSPTNIQVTPSFDSAVISWNAPEFVGNFFGPSAYQQWMYHVHYSVHGSQAAPFPLSTSNTTLTIPDLSPNTLYQFSISAAGPGGERVAPSTIIFYTKSQDSKKLLVATDQGVVRAGLDGQSAEYIARDNSQGSNGIVHDSHNDLYYWIISGSQSSVYKYDGNQTTTAYSNLDNPLSLSFDWVASRLFWVANGDSVSKPLRLISGNTQSFGDPELLLEDTNIRTTTVDSFNGLLFWYSGNRIMYRTLNGLQTSVCTTSSNPPRALAVDVSSSTLYWVSANTGQKRSVVSQISYTTELGCLNDKIDYEIPGNPFGVSSMSLAYSSGSLFFTSYDSSTVCTISAALPSLGDDQVLAMSCFSFDGLDPLPESYRSVFIMDTSRSTQPLPDGISSTGLSEVEPPALTMPPTHDTTSNTNYSVIVIDWEAPSPTSLSLIYCVQYTLQGIVDPSFFASNTALVYGETSLTIEDPTPFTQVNVTIRTASQWSLNPEPVTSSFQSLPDPPGKVRGVRVFVYFPLRDPTASVTALVVWEGLTMEEAGGEVDNYMVTITDMSTGLPVKLEQNGDDRTQYSVQAFEEEGSIAYPLESDADYTVTVRASNAGDMHMGEPSDPVNFSTDAANPPQAVLAVGPGGAFEVGEEREMGGGAVVRAPLDVDTTDRVVYWYSATFKSILNKSLDAADDAFHPMLYRSSSPVLALSYEWIGEKLYFIDLHNQSSREMRIWRVPIIYTEALEQVYPLEGQGIVVPEGARVEFVIDPFRGFAYWTISNQSTTALYQLNLSDPGSPELISEMGVSRRRRQGTGPLLSELSLTVALTFDPIGGRLWVSDATTGDILSCNVTDNVPCTIEVAASDITTGPLGEFALPATSIALDEMRIYWSLDGSEVFYVARDSRNVAVMAEGGDNVSTIVTLSPGLQPLPTDLTCLAPPNVPIRVRVGPELVSRTNTTIEIEWDTLPLRPECEGVVFDFATLTRAVWISPSMENSDARIFITYEPHMVLTGLEPYSTYYIGVRNENQYSERLVEREEGFTATDNRLMNRTLEGVPDPPQNLVVAPLSTQYLLATWDEVTDTDVLRGPLGELMYFISVDGRRVAEINASETSRLLGPNDLGQLGRAYTVEVFVSNGVLTSPAATRVASTWSLPPTPTVLDTTNSSINVSVILTIAEIERIYVEAIKVADNAQNCDGVAVDATPTFRTNETLSTAIPSSFLLTDLEPDTPYCLRVVGRYSDSNATGTVESEQQPGPGVLQRTGAGVPDAPSITLAGSLLSWSEPDTNGQPIDNYLVIARSQEPTVPDIDRQIFITTFDLSQDDFLVCDVGYIIEVVAENSVGPSDSSNVESFTSACASDSGSSSAGPDLVVVVAASVGGLILAVVVLVFLICCIFLYKNGRSKKRRVRLSYAYGPDVELSNLRNNYRHNQAANPHYMWSREDYECSDEDLQQLKFSRQSLKLETFIGQGEFGEVYQGSAVDILAVGTGPTPVAVKTLRKGATPEEQSKFLSEAALQHNFNHPNIVKVLGVCVENDPILIIMELMPAGDLLKFLREAKRDHGPALLTLTEQIQVALDVSQGCRYLEQQHFIHRDIAARNCLVSSRGADRVVKIGDFGLAKDLYSSDYYQVEGQRKLPVRWMAPEALLQGRFTIESDIWSFGVLLWEIMTLGNQPYPAATNQEVLQFVTNGGRLDRPERCPGRIYHLMQNCWKKYASERPHFNETCTILSNFLEHLNRRPESMYESSDEDEDGKGSSRPSRQASIRSGFINLARSGSLKIRNSLRRHGSVHRAQDHGAHNQQSSTEDGSAFRERGPF